MMCEKNKLLYFDEPSVSKTKTVSFSQLIVLSQIFSLHLSYSVILSLLDVLIFAFISFSVAEGFQIVDNKNRRLEIRTWWNQ